MKKAILILTLVFFSISASAQVDITASTATAAPTGVNINVQTICMTNHNLLDQQYTVVGNQINLSVCYYAGILTLVTTNDHTFFVPAPQPNNYTINVTAYSTDNMTTCDFSTVTGFTSYTLGNATFTEAKNNIRLFPNPTKGDLQIEAENLTVNAVKVYNLLGQLVKSSTNLQNDISDLENGSYLVVMETENGSVTKKIILQK